MPGTYYETDVYVSGQDDYQTYRIPSLLVTPAGMLLAFCEGRKNDAGDRGDIDLMVKRSTDNGTTWSPQELIYEEGNGAIIAIGNPCPIVDCETGVIWMAFNRKNKRVFLISSADDGRTWTAPREIDVDEAWAARGHYATGPGVGIRLAMGEHKGRLIIPCDHRDGKDPKDDRDSEDRSQGYGSHVLYSDDHGGTWRRVDVPAPGGNECQVVELTDGSLMLNMRMQTHYQGCRAVSISRDGGETWSPPVHDRNLPCSICQASFIRYSWASGGGKSRLLFSNPASSGDPTATDRKKYKGARVNMTVRLSYDEGKTWPVAKQIHPGPSAYSCLAALPNGEIALLYERGEKQLYETLRLARFSLDWLSDGQDHAS